MMHRSSGELSSGLTRVRRQPEPWRSQRRRQRLSARALLRAPPRVLTSFPSTCCIQSVSSVRIMHSVEQAEAGFVELRDPLREIPILLILDGRMSGWGDGV